MSETTTASEPLHVVVKLINGQDVMGRLRTLSDKQMILYQPITLEPDVSATDFNIAFARFNDLSADEYIPIGRHTIIAASKARPELVEFYNKALDYLARVVDKNVIDGVQEYSRLLGEQIEELEVKEAVEKSKGVFVPNNKTVH